jgi:hypothetical protein
MKTEYCILCSNGTENLRNHATKRCDCIFSPSDLPMSSRLTRCPSCSHFTLATDDESEYKTAFEEEEYQRNQSSYSRRESSKFYFDSTKGREELENIRKQMEELKLQEEDIIASLKRKQKRGKRVSSTEKVRRKQDPLPQKDQRRSDLYPVRAHESIPKKIPIKTSTLPALKLECIAGPCSGQSMHFTGTVIIGSKLSRKEGATSSQRFVVQNDTTVSPDHAKLVLTKTGSKKKPILTVKVHDLKSQNGTKINKRLLPTGSSRQAFVKDSIQIGQSVFIIKKSLN